MTDAPERIYVRWGKAGDTRVSYMEERFLPPDNGGEYIRDTPEALAKSPHVQALVKAHEKEIAVWSENYAALERERDKWFEGAGVHHVASMEQAQRADRAMAALASAQQRIKLLCDNDEWNLGLQEALEVVRAEAAAIREVQS